MQGLIGEIEGKKAGIRNRRSKAEVATTFSGVLTEGAFKSITRSNQVEVIDRRFPGIGHIPASGTPPQL
jgi:hypothetical protein